MPIIAGEWTIDPNAASPPTEDPNIPGLSYAKIAPDSDCKTSYRGSLQSALPNDGDLTGLDLDVSPPDSTRLGVNLECWFCLFENLLLNDLCSTTEKGIL